MNAPAYEFLTTSDALAFEFDSVSATRTIRKVVVYDRFPNVPFLFNLSLADQCPDGFLDDLARTNNDDLERVMATVGQTLFVFFERYPNAVVYFTGSTEARTRLYQIIIAKELADAQQWFVIQGVTNDGAESFQPNKSYKAFLLTWKKPA
jgi:hypothetical protein